MTSRGILSGTRVAESNAAPISPAILGTLLRLLDLLVVGTLGLGIFFLYNYGHAPEALSQYTATILVAMLIASALFQWTGVYAGEYLFSRRLNTDRMLSAWAMTCGVLLVIAFSLKITDFYSRVWTISWFVSSFAVLAIERVALAYLIGRLAREGRFAKRTVVLGAGELGQRLANHLNRSGDQHTRIIGFVDDRHDRVAPEAEGYEVLGDSEHLINLIRRNLVDQVIIALPWQAEERVQDLIRRLAMTPVTIRLAPDQVGFSLHEAAFAQVGGLPMLHVLDRPISDWSYVAKTVEDRVLASIALIFVAPLFAVIAAAIK